MAPSRPAVYGDQLGLLILSLVVIGAGIYVVVRLVTG